MKTAIICWLMFTLLAFTRLSTAQDEWTEFDVSCNGTEHLVGMRMFFQQLDPDITYRFSLFGVGDFAPALVFLENGTVHCSNSSIQLTSGRVAVPTLGVVDANLFSTQTQSEPRDDGTLELLVVSPLGKSGQFALVVDGLKLETPESTHRLQIIVPPAAINEWVGGFMIGGEGTLDPTMILRATDSTGIITEQTCDNAGNGDCTSMPVLVDNGVLLNQRDGFVGDARDAGIAYAGANRLFFTMGATDNTAGEYALIVTGTAPGDVQDSKLICDNVAAQINGASPAYSTLYTPENLVDGNPLTTWVTTIGATNPETNEAQDNVFFVIGLGSKQRIFQVRINGFVPQPDYRQNSLKRFEILVNNASSTAVVALSAEAAQRIGYQTYTFLPTEVSELGIRLISNYGGSLFQIADVQVCAHH